MQRPFTLGDLVAFQATTGQTREGVVIHKIAEKRQPTIFLVESPDRRRAFRFENELTLIAAAESEEAAGRSAGFEGSLASPVFAAVGADD